MEKTAICPGSFDPVTLGHIDIITRASKMFDRVIVAVLINPEKKPVFSTEERIRLLKKATAELKNIEIDSFSGLLAEYARQKNAVAVVKGLRAVSDFEYEFQMSLINKKLNPNLETIFFTSNQDYMYLSSSIVKQVASLNGNINNFVPQCIHDEIFKRLSRGEN